MSDRPKMGVEVNIHTKSSTKSTSKLSTPKFDAPETQADSPFCIAIMGNFSGQQEDSKAFNSRLLKIDRDNLEDIMENFNINLSLNLPDNQNITIELKELDDFHPDSLYEKLESFSKLRSLRRRLKNTTSFADAAAEIQSWLPVEDTSDKKSNDVNDTETTLSITPNDDNLLDSILGTQQEQTTNSPVDASNIDKLIKSIVSPYVEAATDPRQDEMLSIVDKATESHMRDILHHTDFQEMESAWQSLYFLIKRLETDSRLKIFILDISKPQLQADLAVDDLSTSTLYKLFCDPSEGDTPWSVLLGNYRFTDSISDVLSLASIGEIAQQANSPFISAANESLTGCESFSITPDYEDWNHSLSDGVSNAWQILRQSPVASYIGLALPRFLLRLPYGKKSKPIETFTFEEITDEDNHEHYLWGNPAFIKAECLARNFKANGWNMSLSEVFQTDNLPVHYYNNEGETINKPIAEIMLTEKGGEIIKNNGFIPLWSVRNMDCIRSTDYQSIHENAEKLTGRWPK